MVVSSNLTRGAMDALARKRGGVLFMPQGLMTARCPRFEGVWGCPSTRLRELAPKWLTDSSRIAPGLSDRLERAPGLVDDDALASPIDARGTQDPRDVDEELCRSHLASRGLLAPLKLSDPSGTPPEPVLRAPGFSCGRTFSRSFVAVGTECTHDFAARWIRS